MTLPPLYPAIPSDILEFDELWSFVGSKANRVWLWIALCRRTKQIVTYHLGSRDKEDFEKFYKKIPIQYSGCRTRSDQWKTYDKLLWGHKSCQKKYGETTQVEAFNTIIRQRMARLVRRTCAFSKSEIMHEIAIRLFIYQYNIECLSVK